MELWCISVRIGPVSHNDASQISYVQKNDQEFKKIVCSLSYLLK